MKHTPKHFGWIFTGIYTATFAVTFLGITISSLLSANAETPAEIPAEPVSSLILSTANDAYAIKNDQAPNGIEVFVWTEKCGLTGFNNIILRRYDNMGEAIDDAPLNITETENCTRRDHPVISMDRYGNFVVAWEEGPSGNKTVKVKAYKRTKPLTALIGAGTDEFGNLTIATTTGNISASPRIALTKNKTEAENQFIIAWISNDGTDNEIKTRQYSVDFTSNNPPAAVSATHDLTDDNLDQNDLAVAYSTQKAAVTWSNVNNTNISFQALNSNGTLFGQTYLIFNPEGAAYAAEPSVAGLLRTNIAENITDTFLFSWTRLPLNGGLNDIYVKKLHCSTTSCNPADTLNTNSIAVRANTANISAETSPANSEIAIYLNSNDTTREYPEESKTLDQFIVVWEETTEGTRIIRGQNYTGNMSRSGDNFSLIEDHYLSSSNTVSMDEDGDYTVAYSAGSYGVYAKRYRSVLYKRNTETLVNTQDTYAQSAPAVAVGNNGNYVIAYSSASATDAGDIIFKLYNKNGDIILNTNLANTTLDGQQKNPHVAFFNDEPLSDAYGKFIIVWQGNQSDDFDIYYQIFNADGSKDGNEIKANTYLTGDQNTPKVAAAKYNANLSIEKEFIVVWEGEQDGDMKGIGYMYHNAAGNSGAGRANGDTLGEQFRPDVTLSAGFDQTTKSKWVITWQSSRDDAENPTPLGPGIVKVEGTTNSINTASETRVHADISTLTSTVNQSPAISSAEIDGKLYYAISYSNDVISDNQNIDSNILAKTYHHGTATSLQQLTVKENQTPLAANSLTFSDPKIAMDKDTGNILITWTSYTNATNALFEPLSSSFDIVGAFYRLQTNLEPFGPEFRLNSYRSNDQSRAAIGLNAHSAEYNEKIAVAAWVNSGTTGREDNNGIYHQILNYPLFFGISQNLQPEATQEIRQGGKYLVVPSSIDFGTLNPNSSSTFNVRDITSGINYIEIIDLDGVPFNVTVDASDLTFSSNTIAKNLLAVQNGDNSDTSTLGLPNVQEIQKISNNPTPSLILHPSTFFNSANDALTTIDATWPSLGLSQTLATKSGNNMGQWRIFPRFKLIIPSGTPIGTYTGTITFTLI